MTNVKEKIIKFQIKIVMIRSEKYKVRHLVFVSNSM